MLKPYVNKNTSSYIYISVILFSLTFLSGFILSSAFASASDSVVDDVSITIPMACTLSGTGMNTHVATVNPGTYETDIGTTTLKAYCNDNEGFAIYAIGYTDDTDGKNVLTNSTLGSDFDINTGTLTSGNSQWAMKLSTPTNPTPTYPITIENNYNNYHTVPSNYELVAKRTAGTDIGVNAEGSTLTSTYQAYVSNTQPAGTYTGQVKYVMVHPNTAPEPVNSDQYGVTFLSNGLTFAGGTDKNRVIYGPVCNQMYIATTPEVVETSNLTNGVQSGSYASHEHVLQTKTFTGANKVKVIVDYGLTHEAAIGLVAGDWDYESTPTGEYESLYTGETGENISGSKTYIFDSDKIIVKMDSYNAPESNTDYDYGMYARLYPIYTTEQSGTEETTVCSTGAETGTYTTTTTWKGKWYTINDDEIIYFENENALLGYLKRNSDTLLGTNIEVYAYNPYTIFYNGNGATAGTMSGFYTTLETDTISSTADLMAYNFKKTGYGFAGWSENQNATVNSNSKIYGPNEKVAGNELSFDSNREATLYAVWVPSAGNLQGWSGCSSMSNGQVTALTDTRDDNVYTVGKLADGNCWMMENLRLDNTATTLSASNTNNPISAFTTLSSSSDSWCTNNNATCYNQSLLNTNNTNIGGTNSNSTTLVATPGLWDSTHWDDDQYNDGNNDHAQWYGYGNYYNWYSATAGNGTYSKSSGNTDGDICPNGWSLPIGGSASSTNGSFSYLDVQLGGTGSYQYDNEGEEIVSNRWRSYPNNFVYAGLWNGSTAYDRGYYGYYWSRAANNSFHAYYLDLGYSSIGPGTVSYYKNYGRSVRCLAP